MILIDTNVVSESMRVTPNRMVMDWLKANETEIALCAIVLGELAFGIERLPRNQQSKRVANGLAAWQERFAGQILAFDETAAVAYGKMVGAASLEGHPMSVPDGMIAAIASCHGGKVATRNVKDFATTGLKIINPWDFTA